MLSREATNYQFYSLWFDHNNQLSMNVTLFLIFCLKPAIIFTYCDAEQYYLKQAFEIDDFCYKNTIFKIILY
jgi:hypothetical protein